MLILGAIDLGNLLLRVIGPRVLVRSAPLSKPLSAASICSDVAVRSGPRASLRTYLELLGATVGFSTFSSKALFSSIEHTHRYRAKPLSDSVKTFWPVQGFV